MATALAPSRSLPLPIFDHHDRADFSKVVSENHVALGRLAFLLCNNLQQAEDAVAEAYAKVWRRFRKGKVDNLLPYLRQAVVNEVRGGHRRRFLERRHIDLTPPVAEMRSHDGTVSDQQSIWPAVQRLPQDQRMVIVLRYFEDLSEQETARTLGIKVGTVKSRSNRALRQLRALVGDQHE